MLRKALFIIALAGLACSSQETSQSTPAEGTTGGAGVVEGETPPVSAVQPPSAGAQAPSAEAVSCLELVSVGKYAEAVVICETATNQDPTNTAVATALAKAGAAIAAQGAAGAASAAAGNAVEGVKDATSAVGDAASGAAAATGGAIDAAAESAKSAVGAGEEKATE